MTLDPGRSLMVQAQGLPPLVYRQFGTGPGIVIVHGMMQKASDHTELAQALGAKFTVNLLDRRGFGESAAPHAKGLGEEAQDLLRVVETTGSEFVIGVSVGALICLRAMEMTGRIRAGVIFEPPLSVNGSAPTGWIPAMKEQLARGDRIAAMVTAMVGAKMGPPFLAKMPVWLLKLITRTSAAIGGANSPAPFINLAPTLAHDADLVVEAADAGTTPAAVQAPVLLLGALRSPEYFGVALSHLADTLPTVKRATLDKMDHQATGNRARGGDPDAVAAIITSFLDEIPDDRAGG